MLNRRVYKTGDMVTILSLDGTGLNNHPEFVGKTGIVTGDHGYPEVKINGVVGCFRPSQIKPYVPKKRYRDWEYA